MRKKPYTPKHFRGHPDKTRKVYGRYECPTCHGRCTYSVYGTQPCCYCTRRTHPKLEILCGYCENRRDYGED